MSPRPWSTRCRLAACLAAGLAITMFTACVLPQLVESWWEINRTYRRSEIVQSRTAGENHPWGIASYTSPLTEEWRLQYPGSYWYAPADPVGRRPYWVREPAQREIDRREGDPESVSIVASGLPLRCMLHREWAMVRYKGQPSKSTMYTVLEHEGAWVWRIAPRTKQLIVVPLRPILPGMVGNTLLWSVVAAVPFFGVPALRRRSRRRRDACHVCGHDLAGLPWEQSGTDRRKMCPECGARSPWNTPPARDEENPTS